MKILLLGVQLASLVNFRAPLIRDLVAAGHEVVAVAPEPNALWQERLEALGARYIESPMRRTGLNPFADIQLLLWLYRLFRCEKPSILLAFQAKAVIYGLMAARLARVPRRVAMIEGLGLGFIASGDGWRRRLVRFVMPKLYRLALAQAQAVLFLNPDDEAVFRERGLVSPVQEIVRIKGIGIDLAHYTSAPVPPVDQPITFLMIARLLVDKGVREFAEAARLVRESHLKTRFVLLGGLDSSPAGITLDEVKSWHDVEYVGETLDVRPFLQQCHAFVLPSYREGMPRSTLEALATGRAIVTTDTAGCRETVIQGENGFLVKVQNAESLAAAIKDLLNHPAWFIEFGAASRRMAEQQFEVGGINRQIIATLLGKNT